MRYHRIGKGLVPAAANVQNKPTMSAARAKHDHVAPILCSSGKYFNYCWLCGSTITVSKRKASET